MRARVHILAGDERRARQRHAQCLRVLLYQAEVLELEIDPEAGGDVTGDHRGAELIEHPGGRGASEQHPAQQIEIEARSAPEREGLADGLDVDAANQLIAEFDGLPGAGRTDM